MPVRRDIHRQPFPVQLRRRLEMLGPTYIKLGQILSMREDLLPDEVTAELKKLLDRRPAVPHAEFMELVSSHLGRPLDQIFVHVSSTPLGSASIGQIHRATMLDGSQVVLKVVKPGIRETLKRDTILLRGLGNFLQLFFGRYQPKRVIAEFCEYTLREADLTFEADNAESFAAAFQDQPDIVFPEIYHEYSNEKILCMEFLDGIKPTDPEAREMRLEDRVSCTRPTWSSCPDRAVVSSTWVWSAASTCAASVATWRSFAASGPAGPIASASPWHA